MRYIVGSVGNIFKTFGSILSLVNHKRKKFPVFFYVVSDNVLRESFDAVLGCDILDFCVINLENSYLTLNNTNDLTNPNSGIKLTYSVPVDTNEPQKLEKSVENLSAFDKDRVLDLCHEFNDIFFVDGFDVLTSTDLVVHEINLDTDKPIFTKQYPVPHAYSDEMKRQVTKLFNQGVIEKSHSPYTNPVILTMNKNGTFRFVVDMRT